MLMVVNYGVLIMLVKSLEVDNGATWQEPFNDLRLKQVDVSSDGSVVWGVDNKFRF